MKLLIIATFLAFGSSAFAYPQYYGYRQYENPSARPLSNNGFYQQEVTPGPISGKGAAGFRHIYSLDIKDLGQSCPENWTLSTTNSMRMCGKKTERNTCDSLVISTHGQAYTSVRGRIRAFQFGSPDAFMVSTTEPSIDDAYVDGISITHGQNPRKHVFTLGVGVVQYHMGPGDRQKFTCPNTGHGNPQPAFVADKYFCSSGVSSLEIQPGELFSDTPLWTDGVKCDDCMCPRTFCVNLGEQTTDDLELRICTDEALSNEDVRIEMIDLWIK